MKANNAILNHFINLWTTLIKIMLINNNKTVHNVQVAKLRAY